MTFDPLPQFFDLVRIEGDSTNPDSPDFIRRCLGTKVFALENNIVEALKKTNIKSTERHLPFNEITIIPQKLTFEEYEIIGFSFFVLKIEGAGERPMLWRFVGILNPNGDKIATDITPLDLIDPNQYNLTDEEKKKRLQFMEEWMSEMYPKIKLHLPKKVNDKINCFFDAFLNFLNNPEVEIVERKPDEYHNQKRIARGKIPLPTRATIRITGKLKVYLENFQSQVGRYGYSHRFWVRGHFRNFRSEKYTHKKGQKIWIVPYIKGEGILINKIYAVVKK